MQRIDRLHRFTFAILLLAWSFIASTQPSLLEGLMLQEGLVKGQLSPGTKVVFAGNPVRVSSDGDFLIGFYRYEPTEVSLRLGYPDGKVQTKEL